jgi:hypothetical protein
MTAPVGSPEILRKVRRNTIRNSIVFVILALVLLGLGKLWPLLGKVGFWLFAAVIALDTLQYVVAVLGPGLLVSILSAFGKVDSREVQSLWGSTLLRGVDVAVGLVLVWFLYSRLF